MNILIIGGNGFIGSHLIDHLLLDGKNKVRVFDISQERFREPLKNVDYRFSRLDSVADLYEAMLGIDIVYHLATTSVPSTSNVDQVADVQGNLVTSLHILGLMNRLGIRKIVYLSSGGAVYGNIDQDIIGEDAPINPISSYGIVKATVEHYIRLYNRLYGMDYLIVRPSNPYGPRQGHFIAQGVISTFLRKAAMGENLSVYGDGSATKDYIYIGDFVSILCKLVDMNIQGTFNLGSGIGTDINEIISCINTVTEFTNTVVFTPQKSYDVQNFILDIAKLKTAVGEIEFTSLHKGISNTWDWVKTIK
ncbi:NAD-dependent epimerase/dehydratase family protein [Dyadobacter sp. LJ53]|uniref:NAD-dependent epimerase/dehydratase family protein n=1 Tax=Dyadobacter chenwenxiniae TaxID=2906456 RepID=UPI001F2F739F|nr:NAD-dependent epimerase/dehydratase family protein [Dyadobacter chenwenxiniae]MCF0048432.1 NAD-dependent epimerase/dehydratase family protein [Dyadobacter chenwenxiniae]